MAFDSKVTSSYRLSASKNRQNVQYNGIFFVLMANNLSYNILLCSLCSWRAIFQNGIETLLILWFATKRYLQKQELIPREIERNYDTFSPSILKSVRGAQVLGDSDGNAPKEKLFSFLSRRTRGIKSSGRAGNFWRDFKATGSNLASGPFDIRFFFLFFNFKFAWNRTGGGTRTLEKT